MLYRKDGITVIQIGTSQILKVVKKVEFGVYLGEEMNAPSGERILLPSKQVPENAEPGTELEVFVYRDSKDRLIATVRTPLIKLGEVAKLSVIETGKIGAFLDWGLEKDLLLPYAEQTYRVKTGDKCVVSLYLDKSSRLCATMYVYPYLSPNSPYIVGDTVKGTIYQNSEKFGMFVAVDDKYQALIPRKECYGEIALGDEISARVTQVREDGKLDLSVRNKAYEQIKEDSEKILSIIDSFDGVLPFTDKATPEVILRETGMSKNEFKRAIGHLMKEGIVVKTEKAIRLAKR